MKTARSKRLLRAAAAESLERIRLDRGRAPKRLRPILTFILRHLFDPELDVNHLKRRVGVRDNSMALAFHSAIGRPPFRYIQDRRFETGCRLLIDTDLEIWKIAKLLGVSSLQVFSRAFKRWSGEAPVAFRRRHDPDRPKSVDSPVRELARSAGMSELTLLRQALAGQLEAERVGDLIGRLHELYPAAAAASRGEPEPSPEP